MFLWDWLPLPLLNVFFDNHFIEFLATTSIDEITRQFEEYPKFFADAMQWGLDAGFKALAYLCGLSLLTYMFRR